MSVVYTGSYTGPAILLDGYAGTDGDKNLSISGRIGSPIEVKREDFTVDYKMLFYVPTLGNHLGENFAEYEMSSTIEILIRVADPYNKWFSYNLTELDPLGFIVTDLGTTLYNSIEHKKIQIQLRSLQSWIPEDKITLDEIALSTQIYEISSRVEFAKKII